MTLQNGRVVYNPNSNFNGPAGFTYTVCDSGSPQQCATATVEVTVTAVNDPPVARDDAAATNEDVPVAVDVRANDSVGPDNESSQVLTVTEITRAPAGGEAAIVQSGPNAGRVRYTPNANFNGTDTFEYRVCDNGNPQQCATATVTVDVAAVNDPPRANDDTAGAVEGGAPVDVAVLGNDTDGPDQGETLTITANSQPPAGQGTVQCSTTNCTYTPNADFFGTTSFTYTISDGNGGTSTATVTVAVEPVNDPPVADDENVDTDEDTPVVVNVLQGDSPGPANESGQTLTVTDVSDPAGGTASVIQSGADAGSVRYTPDPNYNGPDTFTYTVCDSGSPERCDTATVNVTVAAVNDPPVARNDAATTDEDTPVAVAVLGNDTDAEGAPVPASVRVVGGPDNGAATANADGTITYTPNSNFNGTDAFTYAVGDGDGGTDTATVTITVTPVNDPPVARGDQRTVAEDGALSFPASDLTANDSPGPNEGEQTLTVNGVGNATNGTVTLQNGRVVYNPNSNFNGPAGFTYTVCDSGSPQQCATATVEVTVTAVNDPPVARDDAAATNEDSAVAVDTTANDFPGPGNESGQTLTVTDVSDPANGTAAIIRTGANAGKIRYTPDPNYNGPDTFTYTVCDSGSPERCDTATVNVTVAAVNDPPVARNDAATTDEDVPVNIPALRNDSDVEGDALSIDGVSDPANGAATANADGTITYTPEADFFGTDTFTYTVSDGQGGTDTATVTVTVDSVNDRPVADDDEEATPEDTPVAINVLQGDIPGPANEADQTLTVNAIVRGPANGTASIIQSGPNAGRIRYEPNANYNGPDSFTYRVCDSGDPRLCGTATVTVTVGSDNDPPSVQNDAAQTAEDEPVTIDILGNDQDPDGALLPGTVEVVRAPASGTATVNADGSITYTPEPDSNGPDSFAYTVCDDGDPRLCEVANVSVTVTEVNDPPTATDVQRTVAEDRLLDFPADELLANDSPGPNEGSQTLTVTEVGQAQNGTVTLQNGRVSFRPTANFNGPASFSYTICDSGSPRECATATVNVTVTAVNDPPVARNDTATTDEDTAVAVAVLDGDTAGAGEGAQTLTVTEVTDPASGTASIIEDGPNAGQVNYVPDRNFSGTDTFTYEVCDDGSPRLCDTATVTVTVDPVNDPPVARANAYEVREDGSLNIGAPGLLANDTDTEDDALTAEVASGPQSGTLTLDADGSFVYEPDANFSGTDTFTYRACDDSGACSEPATITLTVNAINDAPRVDLNGGDPGTGNTAAFVEGGGPARLAPDDLAVTDVDGTSLASATVTITNLPDGQAESLLVDTSGTGITAAYDPATGQLSLTGPASRADFERVLRTVRYSNVSQNPTIVDRDVTFVVDDGQDVSNVATVVVSVRAVNNRPDISLPGGELGYAEDDPATPLDAGATLDDPDTADYDGGNLTVSFAQNGATGDRLGIQDEGAGAGQIGVDANNVTYGGVVIGTFSGGTPATPLVVNFNENATPAAAQALLRNLTYATSSQNPPVAPRTVTIVLADGNGQTSNTASKTVNVGRINDAPTNTVPDPRTIDEDSFAVFTGAGDRVVVDDADAGSSPVSVTLTVNNGTLRLGSTGGVDVTGDGTGTVTVVGPLGRVNAALDGLRYNPDPGYNGQDTLQVTTSDQGASGAGGPLGDTDSVQITVLSENDAPTARADGPYSTGEDTPLSVGPANGVLANDEDDGPAPLTAEVVAGPQNGTLTLDPDGSFVYTPDANYEGPDAFTYRACDGDQPPVCSETRTVSLNVGSDNDPPVADPDARTIDEDSSAIIEPRDGDSPGPANEGAQVLTVTNVSTPANGTAEIVGSGPDAGKVRYVPDPDFNGTDTFDYTVCDSGDPRLCDTATVTVTVNPVNDPPVAQNDDGGTIPEDGTFDIAAGELTANDSPGPANESAQNLTVIEVNNARNGRATLQNGRITFTPNDGYSGPAGFEYTVCDGTPGRCDTAVVSLTVAAVNDAPTARDNEYETPEDTTLTVPSPGVLGDDTDDGPAPLTAQVVVGPQKGTLTLDPDGSFVYRPNPDTAGVDAFTYRACDAGQPPVCSEARTVTIFVEPVNDPPVADDESVGTNEDTPVVVNVRQGDSPGPANESGQTLTVNAITQGPANGTASIIQSGPDAGNVRYEPNANYNGTDTFTYRVCDSGVPERCATATVTVVVSQVNDPPTAVRDVASTLQDRPVTVNVVQNDTDPDGNLNRASVEVVSGGGPSNGQATANANGTIVYTPNSGFTGSDTFRYRVCDGSSPPLCDEASVVIQVRENPPQADIIVNSSAPDRVTVGRKFTYTVTVTNAGPDTSQNVVLRSVLPASVRFIDAPAGCTYNRGQRAVVCNLGDIGNGGRKVSRIRVEAVRGGNTTFRANISSDTRDPNPANNTDSDG